MAAVLLTGYGGFERLEYREDIPVPVVGHGEVLIQVRAAGVNNTDINTRTGWYSKAVRSGTADAVEVGFTSVRDPDATWTGRPLTFPRIQGADCCGHIVAVGEGVDADRIGERVIVRNMLRSHVDYRPFECWVFGSQCDGAFAQYTKAPSRETYKVECDWSNAELACVPCAYSTAEGMLNRANVQAGDRVVITGASGGVGSAAIQLARRRGAIVTAVAATAKTEEVRALGADQVIPREANLVKRLGCEFADVVIDVVAGPRWPGVLEVLKRGGRYAVAGAIAGPLVELDMRALYLKDLSFFGCTFQDDIVFENLVTYIEREEIHPIVAKTYPLKDIVTAQRDFLSKGFVGKLVLIPPQE
jgi:NADPH:quinone reductase-like Zn-dependent oxidoreductase